MKMIIQSNRKVWTSLAAITVAASAVVAHVIYVSHPHPWFSATFSTGEEIQIVWQPGSGLWERLLGHGRLVCEVADEKTIDLVYGEYGAYERTNFQKQGAVAYGDNDNLIPAFTITETVKGAQWCVDHRGIFLGSN
jgi:hypothetical protein